MNGRNLFLDDIRVPMDAFNYTRFQKFSLEEWDIVRDYDGFVHYIETNGLPDFIAFDHDLADEHYAPEMYHGSEAYMKISENFKEKTGYDCARWLVEYCMDNNLDCPDYIVHSMNPAGKQNIESYLENFKKSKEFKYSKTSFDGYKWRYTIKIYYTDKHGNDLETRMDIYTDCTSINEFCREINRSISKDVTRWAIKNKISKEDDIINGELLKLVFKNE